MLRNQVFVLLLQVFKELVCESSLPSNTKASRVGRGTLLFHVSRATPAQTKLRSNKVSNSTQSRAGDLLFHVSRATPAQTKLRSNKVSNSSVSEVLALSNSTPCALIQPYHQSMRKARHLQPAADLDEHIASVQSSISMR